MSANCQNPLDCPWGDSHWLVHYLLSVYWEHGRRSSRHALFQIVSILGSKGTKISCIYVKTVPYFTALVPRCLGPQWGMPIINKHTHNEENKKHWHFVNTGRGWVSIQVNNYIVKSHMVNLRSRHSPCICMVNLRSIHCMVNLRSRHSPCICMVNLRYRHSPRICMVNLRSRHSPCICMVNLRSRHSPCICMVNVRSRHSPCICMVNVRSRHSAYSQMS